MKKAIVILFIILNSFVSICAAGSYSGYVIGLDPGHGGSDPGALGYNGSSYPDEADVNLSVSQNLKSSLETQGASVGTTRSSDTDVSLSARVNYINSLTPDAYVSIHCNSYSSSSANGTETYWHTYGTTADQELAGDIQTSLVDALGTSNRGVKQAQFYVLGVNSSIPAVLAELLFISNQTEFNYITTTSGQQTAANALDSGIKAFLNLPDSSFDVRLYSDISASPNPICRYQPVTVTVKIANYGDAVFSGDISAALHDSTGQFLEDIEVKYNESISSMTAKTYTFNKSSVYTSPGYYTLQIKYQPSGGNWDLVPSGSYTNDISIQIQDCTPPEPDLTPSLRSGWDNKIVISNTTGTTTSSSTIYDDETIYVDYSCANQGEGDATEFYYGLYIDGSRRKSAYVSSLQSNYNSAVIDSDISALSSGNHTFEVRCDCDDDVSEPNESNNNYSRSFYITNAPDTTDPSISITSPTSSSTYATSSSSITIGGSASDNVGVTQVTWSNNRGGSGTASGTTSWSNSGITLYSGTNILTVTARDAAGNTSSDTLTVTYTLLGGDINQDGTTNLVDLMLGLQIISGITPAGDVFTSADINNDSRIGTEEVIYILQKISTQ